MSRTPLDGLLSQGSSTCRQLEQRITPCLNLGDDFPAAASLIFCFPSKSLLIWGNFNFLYQTRCVCLHGGWGLKCRTSSLARVERDAGTGTSQFGREPLSLYVVVENTLNESSACPASAARRCHSVPIIRNAPTATWTGFRHPKTRATTSSVWLL